MVSIVNNVVTYRPGLNKVVSDSFTCDVDDNFLETATVTVNVTINAENDDPQGGSLSTTVNEDSAAADYNIVALVTDVDIDNEGDTLSLISCGDSAVNGILVVNNAPGTITYTPGNNDTNGDSFDCTVNDAAGASATVSVTISITPENDPPTANGTAPTLTIDEDGSGTVKPADFASDVDDDTLSVSSCTDGAKGTTSVGSDNVTVTYSGNNDANGSDSFDCVVTDGDDNVTVTTSVTINALNDAPSTVNDSLTLDEDQVAVAEIDVLDNDIDTEGD